MALRAAREEKESVNVSGMGRFDIRRGLGVVCFKPRRRTLADF